jgi:ferric-dicitrate binding protein FerR (iron transport regulator)
MGEAELRERIALLLDADLETEERRALEALIRRDPESRQRHRELLGIWTLLDHYAPITATRDVAEDLVSQAQSEARIEKRGRIARLAAGWAAAAAIFLAVFLGLPDKAPEDVGSGYSTGQRNGVEISEDYTLYAACSFDFEDF